MVFPTTHSPLLYMYLTALRRFIGSPEAVPGCLFLVFEGKAKGGAYLQGRNSSRSMRVRGGWKISYPVHTPSALITLR